MDIKVLGTGCPKCKKLEERAKKVVQELGIDAEISKVEDITDIMNYGIRRTPGLVINEKVVFSGRIATEKEITQFIEENR